MQTMRASSALIATADAGSCEPASEYEAQLVDNDPKPSYRKEPKRTKKKARTKKKKKRSKKKDTGSRRKVAKARERFLLQNEEVCAVLETAFRRADVDPSHMKK